MIPEDITRAVKMLRIAAYYIRFLRPDGVVRYDDAECDGHCVADDCEKAAREMLEHASDRDYAANYSHG